MVRTQDIEPIIQPLERFADAGDDLMGDSVQILPKPYEIEALARKLRECLGDA